MKIRKRKTIQIIFIIAIVLLNVLYISSTKVFAADDIIYITLSDSEIKVDENAISTDTSSNIYLTDSMNNGGSNNEALESNEEIDNVININSSGTYEFEGSLSNGQISIDSNKINGDVTIILNNASITCKNAPAIFVYNTQTNSSNCTVTIKTVNGTNNTITGDKLKQSVEEWSDQNELLYYVEKGYDDDQTYYERYKYDGAISSDISLTFEGEGTLTVNSTAKEGIESKRDITINSGNYIINSLDDGINACAENESIITINGGSVLVNVQEEAEEGDGIDSNGSIVINGGYVYAFACESSQDSGIDSDKGISINGGYVVSIGNMADEISSDSKQSFVGMQFMDKVEKNTLITLVNEDEKPVAAFESDRDYSVLVVSTPNIENVTYIVYEGGQIEGTSENGFYTEITSYTKGTEREWSNLSNKGIQDDFDEPERGEERKTGIETVILYTGVILAIGLIIAIVIAVVLKKKGKFDMKGKILVLIIGILIGALLATGGFYIYSKMNPTPERQFDMNRGEMPRMQNETRGTE